jgi:hypothetical protein
LNSTIFQNSSILNQEDSIKLLQTIQFSPNQNFTLVYQASKDGFSSSDFHRKSNGIKNTLVLVKTTKKFIFGGYTSQDWSGNQTFKQDNQAFLFSLVNAYGKPARLNITYPSHAILAVPSFGPSFGSGIDLFIADKSNENMYSSSYLGISKKILIKKIE